MKNEIKTNPSYFILLLRLTRKHGRTVVLKIRFRLSLTDMKKLAHNFKAIWYSCNYFGGCKTVQMDSDEIDSKAIRGKKDGNFENGSNDVRVFFLSEI